MNTKARKIYLWSLILQSVSASVLAALSNSDNVREAGKSEFFFGLACVVLGAVAIQFVILLYKKKLFKAKSSHPNS